MTHTCHAIACETPCPPKMFMCFRHWKRLPKEHQSAVWHEYRPGQEQRGDPSLSYLIVSMRARIALAKIEQVEPSLINDAIKTLAWLESKTTSRATQASEERE